MEKKKNIALLVSGEGFEYYPDLPPGWRPAKVDDFHNHSRRKIGLKYLVKGSIWQVYQLQTLTKKTNSKDIIEWIKQERIWVQETH